VRAISLCSFPCVARSFACASFVAISTLCAPAARSERSRLPTRLHCSVRRHEGRRHVPTKTTSGSRWRRGGLGGPS
jgi:hypothetical protein